MKVLSHNFTGKSLVVVFQKDGKTRTKIVEASHPNWGAVVALYKKGKVEELVPLLDMDKAISAQFNGVFVVKGEKVYYNGQEAHGYLMDKILLYMRDMPKQAPRLIKFAENLYSNPDNDVINRLFKFLEHKHMPITEDGCFLAYKGVSNDYYSITSGDIEVIKGKVKDGKIYNGIREEVVVKRSQVCSDPNQGCAKGLHVGSWEYANGFKNNGRLMVLKVNPRDAVEVPHDCSYQKLRACRYEVLAEDSGKLSEVHDLDFDKQASKQPLRDRLGRFTRFCRNSLGRFIPKS